MNQHYLRTMDIVEIAALVKPFLEEEGLWDAAYEAEKKEWFTSTLSFSFFTAVSLKWLVMGPVFKSTGYMSVPSSSSLRVSVRPSIAYLLALYAPLDCKEIIPRTEECWIILP